MVLKNKKVAILGAGPVGLTLARLLQQKGTEVTVYERDKNAQTRIWGGTLDLHKGSGQDALKEAGLPEKYYAMARPMGRTLTDEQGNVLLRKNILPEEQYDNPEINRNDLRTLLLHSLTNGTVVWDRKFTELEERNGRWLLHFEKERTAVADFVVGANGGRSGVRKYVTDTEVETTGSFIIQGEVVAPATKCPQFVQLCGGNILMAAYRGNILIANPDNNGVLTYNVIGGKPDEWGHDNGPNVEDTDHVSTLLSDKFSDWDGLYGQLFRSTTAFWGLPTQRLPLDRPWKGQRPLPLTLIGDAAHLMPPFAGQGVNIGLMDALVLATNLTSGNFKTIEAAINDYERMMFVYAQEAQRETSRNELAMRQPDFSFEKLFKQ